MPVYSTSLALGAAKAAKMVVPKYPPTLLGAK